jgi:hypothetical protein
MIIVLVDRIEQKNMSSVYDELHQLVRMNCSYDKPIGTRTCLDSTVFHRIEILLNDLENNDKKHDTLHVDSFSNIFQWK